MNADQLKEQLETCDQRIQRARERAAKLNLAEDDFARRSSDLFDLRKEILKALDAITCPG